jgi:NAD(P)-dependent dehydrogenase (short-subunit alcohol dehydrogenase family)
VSDRDPAALAGKVAVVTGAASGIGAATARRLAGSGVRVVVTDIAEPAGRAVAEEVGGRFVALDVGDAAGWAALVADVERELGGIDLAHLNAGLALGAYPLRIERITDDEYRRIQRVNADGVFLGIRAVVPSMTARGGGAIVATSSLAGIGPHADDPVYAATKHFVVGLVRSLGPALREHHITVNAVCPGGVDTPLLDTTGRRPDILAAGRPLMDPDEVARVVVDLMSGDETGAVHTVVHGRGGERYEFRGVPGPRPVADRT